MKRNAVVSARRQETYLPPAGLGPVDEEPFVGSGRLAPEIPVTIGAAFTAKVQVAITLSAGSCNDESFGAPGDIDSPDPYAVLRAAHAVYGLAVLEHVDSSLRD